jgi:sugar transferase (PEP-CTERM/EpsH1 system associated)
VNILFVVPYVPNLIRVRPYNLIRFLSAKGHRVTVLTPRSTEKDEQDIDELKALCHNVYSCDLPSWRSFYNVLKALPGSVPLQAVYSWHPVLAKRARTILEDGATDGKFDIVHVEHLRGARYGLFLKSQDCARATIPIVWDSVDCISHLFRQASKQSKKGLSRWLTRFELSRTEKYESWLMAQFDRVLVTSRVDKEAFKSIRESGWKPDFDQKISVLPNGVDLNYFHEDSSYTREPATVVVSGKMSYHANVTMTLHLVKNIMPLVWSRRDDVKLWIVGKDPAREILALSENRAITVTGTVKDIRPYLLRAAVAVTPITYGAGIQNKVLEAMACSTPVVSSSQAVSSLDVKPEIDLLVADQPNDFAEKVTSLLDDSERRRNIGQSGRNYVMLHHDWNMIVDQLEEIYYQVLSQTEIACLTRN